MNPALVIVTFFFQLNRLSENGEESLLLTATASDLQNPAPVYSKLGGRFYETDSTGFQNIGKRFQKYCQGEFLVRISHGFR